MKILVLTDIFPGKERPASGTYIYELSHALSYKNQIVVISPKLWNPIMRKSHKTQDNYHDYINGIKVYRPKLFILPKGDRLVFRAIVYFLISSLLIRKLRKQFCFDLIHAHMAGPAGFAAILLGIIFRKPVIVTAHGSDIHSFPKHFFLKHMVVFTLKRATQIVAVSQSLKDSMLKMIRLRREIFVIRNGANHEVFFPTDKTIARKQINLPHNKKIILFIGNLLPVKGIDLLLHAFANVSKKVSTKRIIIGKGESACELKDLTNELPIDTHVSFIGIKKHNEIPLWLNACDVFCLPSRNEGFPTVIVEALACGRPVVATRVGGIPDAVTNDTLGILVEPNNTEDLALALSKALEKKWDYQSIAEYGKRFSWDTIAEEYTELYKNVISKK